MKTTLPQLNSEIEAAVYGIWPKEYGGLLVKIQPEFGRASVTWPEDLRILGTPLCNEMVAVVVRQCQKYGIYDNGVDYGNYSFNVHVAFDSKPLTEAQTASFIAPLKNDDASSNAPLLSVSLSVDASVLFESITRFLNSFEGAAVNEWQLTDEESERWDEEGTSSVRNAMMRQLTQDSEDNKMNVFGVRNADNMFVCFGKNGTDGWKLIEIPPFCRESLTASITND